MGLYFSVNMVARIVPLSLIILWGFGLDFNGQSLEVAVYINFIFLTKNKTERSIWFVTSIIKLINHAILC